MKYAIEENENIDLNENLELVNIPSCLKNMITNFNDNSEIHNLNEMIEEYNFFLETEIKKELLPYLDKTLSVFAEKAYFDCFLYVTLCNEKEECKGCDPFYILRDKIIVYNINHLRKKQFKILKKEVMIYVIKIILNMIKKIGLDIFIFNQRINNFSLNLEECKKSEEKLFSKLFSNYINEEGLNLCNSCNYNYPEIQTIFRISWAKVMMTSKKIVRLMSIQEILLSS